MSVIFLHPDGDIAGRTTMSGSEIRKMLPAEALVRAISQTTGMKFGNVKVGFDSFLTVSAMVVALLAFHRLNGVREGTLINAIAVGNIVKLWRKLLEGAVTVFLEK